MHWWPLNRPQAPADVAATQRSTATSLPNQLQVEATKCSDECIAPSTPCWQPVNPQRKQAPHPAGTRRTRVDLRKRTAKPPHIKVTARCPLEQQPRVTYAQRDKGNRSSRHHSAGCSRMALERSTMGNPGRKRWWAAWQTVNSKVKVFTPATLREAHRRSAAHVGLLPNLQNAVLTHTHCQLADPANSTAPLRPADPCRQGDDPPKGSTGLRISLCQDCWLPCSVREPSAGSPSWHTAAHTQGMRPHLAAKANTSKCMHCRANKRKAWATAAQRMCSVQLCKVSCLLRKPGRTVRPVWRPASRVVFRRWVSTQGARLQTPVQGTFIQAYTTHPSA
jgi:hypothetical protein